MNIRGYSYGRSSHAEHHSDPEVLILLHRVKWNIMHTCVHEEEPVFGPLCIEHILEEVDEIHEEICAVGELLAPMYVKIDLYDSIHHTIDEMADILDTLHEELRSHLAKSAQPTQSPALHDAIRALLSKSCQALKKVYHDLLRKLSDEGYVSTTMKNRLELK